MKISKLKLITLLALILPMMANASLINKFIQKYMTRAYTSSHSLGLPKKVESLPEAEAYRADFIEQMGIVEYEKKGITLYKNNKKGMAIIEKNNRKEPAFKAILNSGKNYNKLYNWKNGKDLIKRMKDYTKKYSCIPKLTSTSHGWRSTGRTGEGHGISGTKGFNGFYVSYVDGPEKVAKMGSRTIKEHLVKEIKKGSIKFCNSCIAQFYACNVSTKFAKEFAKATGCQAIVATGQNSPQFQSLEKDGKFKYYNGVNYWKSDVGSLSERSSKEEKAKGELKAGWYRATPIKNSHNEVVDIVEENLGRLYIAL